MLPKKATATASNSGGGRAECPRLSVNIGGARNREENALDFRIGTTGYGVTFTFLKGTSGEKAIMI